MKRRSFIRETTTVITGLGLASSSCTLEKNNILEKTFEVYVTMEDEKVSFHITYIPSIKMMIIKGKSVDKCSTVCERVLSW